MKEIGIFESTSRKESIEYAEMAVSKLKDKNLDCYADPSLIEKFKSEELKQYVNSVQYKDFEKHVDLVISFGGDGTMLSAARFLINSDVPIMGFNVGKLGFLAEYSVENFDKILNDLITGNYRVIERAVLETEFEGEVIYALNDFVIEKKDSSRLITIDAFTNDHLIASIRADGLIVTTPTGSTAYSLSCGGPIIAPSTKVICLTPISPHTLTLRPLVLSDNNSLTFKVFSPTNEAILVADGQVKRILNNSEIVIIKKSNETIKLIKPTDSTYYDLLRQKLLWAADAVNLEKIKNNQ